MATEEHRSFARCFDTIDALKADVREFEANLAEEQKKRKAAEEETERLKLGLEEAQSHLIKVKHALLALKDCDEFLNGKPASPPVVVIRARKRQQQRPRRDNGGMRMYRSEDGKLGNWRVSFTHPITKQKVSRAFSIAKYGDKEARELAEKVFTDSQPTIEEEASVDDSTDLAAQALASVV